MRLGYFLSSEEFGPRELVRQARMAEDAGFHGLWISDHFHPWNDTQGHSGFVWSTIGAISQATTQIKLATSVTCPTVRIHPAIIAHAAATSAVLLDGRFALGLGSGEALDEHILGDHWPEAEVRLEMLEEAVHVIRTLWQGGMRSDRGRHYRVEKARLYDLPERLPPILISGFGPKATSLAARIGDGYVTVHPDEQEVKRFREAAGGGSLVAGGMKVRWAEDERRARSRASALWPNEQLPGEARPDPAEPAHFDRPPGWSARTWWPKRSRAAPISTSTRGPSSATRTPASTSSTSSRSAPNRSVFFDVYASNPSPFPSA